MHSYTFVSFVYFVVKIFLKEQRPCTVGTDACCASI